MTGRQLGCVLSRSDCCPGACSDGAGDAEHAAVGGEIVCARMCVSFFNWKILQTFCNFLELFLGLWFGGVVPIQKLNHLLMIFLFLVEFSSRRFHEL